MTQNAIPRLLERAASLHGKLVDTRQLTPSDAGDDGSDPLAVAERAWPLLIDGASTERVSLKELQPDDYPAMMMSGGMPVLVRPDNAGGHIIERPSEQGVPETLSPDTPVLSLRAPGKFKDNAARSREEQDRTVPWFWREIRKFRKTFIEIGLGSFAANTLALGGSIFAMQVYDRVVPNAAYQTLWVLAVGLSVAIAFEMLIRAARAQLLDSACKQIDVNLSSQLFRHLLSIKMNARPQSLGTLAAQVRDFEVVRGFLTSTSLFALADLPFVALFLLVVWLIGGPIVWVPLALFAITLMVAAIGQAPLRRLSELHIAESNQRNGLLVEAIDGAEMLKATGAEWQMSKHWQDLTEQLSVDALHIRSVSNLTLGASNALQQIGYAGIIVAGAYQIGAGELTMGALIACSILSGRIFAPITQIVGLAFQWNHARIALRALNGLMRLPTDLPTERPVIKESIAARLSVESLVFQYAPDAKPTVTVGKLEFQPGEKVAVVGATGSGKSTLIKLLAGIYAPSGGRVFLDGIDLALMDPRQLRSTIGYLPQDIRLFQGTLRENLTRGLGPVSDDEILERCKQSGLFRLIAGNPKGLGLEIFEGGRGLSGGQRQLVGLTRTLIGNPKILLLDEPTSAMDQQLEMHTLRSLFSQIDESRLLVCVTHRSMLMNAVDRIIILESGRIAVDGPKGDVMARLAELQRSVQKPPVSAASGAAA
jgi:ATP-binding cassette subfamily C protein LapB